MGDKKDINIVGAGPAGLVAAINLNREGFNVILHERQDSVGGEPGWHPSVHSTPVDIPGLWDYIGIDCSEAFTDISGFTSQEVMGKSLHEEHGAGAIGILQGMIKSNVSLPKGFTVENHGNHYIIHKGNKSMKVGLYAAREVFNVLNMFS